MTATPLDPDRLNPGEHACPVQPCGLSVEEHHRLTRGTRQIMADLSAARRRIADLEEALGIPTGGPIP